MTHFSKLPHAVSALLLALALSGCQSTPTTPVSVPETFSPAQTDAAMATLEQAQSEYYQGLLQRYPYQAFQKGLTLTPQLAATGTAADDEWYQQLADLEEQLEQMPHGALPARQQLYARALQYRLGQQQEWRQCKEHWSSLGPQAFLPQQVLEQLGKHFQAQTIPDFQALLNTMSAAAEQLKAWQVQLEQQQAKGVVNLDSERAAALAYLDRQLAGYPFSDSSTPSPFWVDIQQQLTALKLYPSSQDVLQADAKSAVTNHLLPVLRSLRATIKSLNSQPQLSWQQQPGGDACYRLQLSQLGATDAPELLQEIAKSRLAALQQQLRVELQLDDTQPLAQQLRAWLASNRVAPGDVQSESLKRLRAVSERLPYAFESLPTTELVIQPETNPAIHHPHYQPPKPLLGLPGIYYTTAQTHPNEWRWPLDLYKDTLPGKHLQYAMAQENPQLPDFLKTDLEAAFEPGWPDIAAELASDLGGYQSPSEHAWVLLDEMEQELNLVLDVAVHLYEWDNAKANQYCQLNSFMSEKQCSSRIAAIRAQPAHFAHAAISRANILALMQDAEAAASQPRALLAFHSDWLKQGTLPAALYPIWLDAWLQSH